MISSWHENFFHFHCSTFTARRITYRRGKKVSINSFTSCAVMISMLACFRGYKRSNGLKFPVNNFRLSGVFRFLGVNIVTCLWVELQFASICPLLSDFKTERLSSCMKGKFWKIVSPLDKGLKCIHSEMEGLTVENSKIARTQKFESTFPGFGSSREKMSEEKIFLIKSRDENEHWKERKTVPYAYTEFIITRRGGERDDNLRRGQTQRWFLFRERGEMLLIRKRKFQRKSYFLRFMIV